MFQFCEKRIGRQRPAAHRAGSNPFQHFGVFALAQNGFPFLLDG